MKNLIFSLFCMLISSSLFAQNQFDVRFSLSDVDCTSGQVCYDVQISSVNGTNFDLAGQNYRIYYDNSKADYSSGTSSLPTSSFSNFNLVQDVGPLDATGFSTSLGFENTLGFLNYFIDLADVDNGGNILIPSNGAWVTTSNLCFTVPQSVIDNNAECINLVWAKDGYTNSLATAFVEVAEWEGPQNTNPVVPIPNPTHDNLDSSDGDQSCFTTSCIADVYITDGVSNENDGTVVVEVCLSESGTMDVDVVVSTQNGSAQSPDDFTSLSMEDITIATGQTCADVIITIIDNNAFEPNEVFQVIINSVSEGNIIDNSATITIVDNEQPPVNCNANAATISFN